MLLIRRRVPQYCSIYFSIFLNEYFENALEICKKNIFLDWMQSFLLNIFQIQKFRQIISKYDFSDFFLKNIYNSSIFFITGSEPQTAASNRNAKYNGLARDPRTRSQICDLTYR